MSYLKDWEKAKKDFATRVVGELKNGGAGVPAEVRQNVVELIKTDTGMTPALKVVDAAFSKKHRKVAMQGLTKVHAVIEKTAMQVQRVALGAGKKATEVTDTVAQDALNEIQMAGLDFKRELTAFETRIAKQIESLQKEKSPTGQKIDIISLEGDMEGALAKFKKDVKQHAAAEKKYKVLTETEPAVTAMKAYSKAAARTEVKQARESLEAFFAAVDKLVKFGAKIAADKPAPDKDYLKAVGILCDALKTIKLQRGTVSYKNLQQLEAAAPA